MTNTTYYVRDVAGQVMAVYNDAFGPMTLVEQPMYGAGRVGIAYSDLNNQKTYVYQLTDHLGNVRAVFGTDGNEVGLKGFTDYYPGGMAMPNRTLSGAEGYRYAFSYYIETDLWWSAMFSRVNICQLFKFIVSMIQEKEDPYLFLPTSP